MYVLAGSESVDHAFVTGKLCRYAHFRLLVVSIDQHSALWGDDAVFQVIREAVQVRRRTAEASCDGTAGGEPCPKPPLIVLSMDIGGSFTSLCSACFVKGAPIEEQAGLHHLAYGDLGRPQQRVVLLMFPVTASGLQKCDESC